MAATDFAVRPLRESDLEEWLRLRKLLWDGNDEQDHRSEMLDILSHPETQLVMVADDGNGRLAGFLEASIRPFAEDCETDHVGYVEGWFVEDPHRRRGIGRELVATAESCTAGLIGDRLDAAHASLGYKETSRLVHFRKELK